MLRSRSSFTQSTSQRRKNYLTELSVEMFIDFCLQRSLIDIGESRSIIAPKYGFFANFSKPIANVTEKIMHES